LAVRMKFIIDILHPAHVHFFRNFIKEMSSKGHRFMITAREKDCATQLLEAYGLKYELISKMSKGITKQALELAGRTIRFLKIARSFQPDYLIGVMGPTIALAGKLLASKTVVFYDTEIAFISNFFSYPLADLVVTPSCYQRSVGRHHLTYEGYHELAYLHPKRFTPDEEVLLSKGINSRKPYFVLRFVSWHASHDIGARGFSSDGKNKLVEILSDKGQVYISSEEPLPSHLKPYQLRLPVESLHHLLAYAKLFVGESATMASEAAVLGTHSVFISRGYTDELEKRYGLVYNFTQDQETEALAKVIDLLKNPDLKAEASWSRERMLEEKIDATAWMVDLFEQFQMLR
jgi:predicted glycosyltransferase